MVAPLSIALPQPPRGAGLGRWTAALGASVMLNVAVVAGITLAPKTPAALETCPVMDMAVYWVPAPKAATPQPTPQMAENSPSKPVVTPQPTSSVQVAEAAPPLPSVMALQATPTRAHTVTANALPTPRPAAAVDSSSKAANTMPNTTNMAQAGAAAPSPAGAMGLAKRDVIEDAQYRRKTTPQYPRRAFALGQQGLVVLHAYIGPNGKAQNLKIEGSSGYKLLDQAALSAVKSWEFEPVKRNGQAVSAWVRVPVNFSIRG